MFVLNNDGTQWWGGFFPELIGLVGEFFGNCEGKKWRKMKNAFFWKKLVQELTK
jgi:hypothetical protein